MRDRPGKYEVKELLDRALNAPRSYEELCDEPQEFWEILTENSWMRNYLHDLSPDQRYHFVRSILNAVDGAVYDRAYGRNGKNRIPEAAFAIVRHAIELIIESGPTGRTMIAYRNRHHDFLEALAELALLASGNMQANGDFYTALGKQVAHAALDHDTGRVFPRLAPEPYEHETIVEAAFEKLVYFIGAESGPIKIGIASNPKMRLATLQTAHHEKLTILAVTGGGQEAERKYHERFAAFRLQGEWFDRNPELITEIDYLNSEAADSRARVEGTTLATSAEARS